MCLDAGVLLWWITGNDYRRSSGIFGEGFKSFPKHHGLSSVALSLGQQDTQMLKARTGFVFRFFYTHNKISVWKSKGIFSPTTMKVDSNTEYILFSDPSTQMETCIQPVGLGGVSRGSQACVWFTWGPGPTAEPLTDKVPCEWRTNSSGLSAVAGIHQAPVWGQGALRNYILKPQSSGRKVCCHSTHVKTHKFTSKRKVTIHVHLCHNKTTLLWSTTGLYNCFSS